MIRKAFIIMLSMLAAGTVVMWIVSYTVANKQLATYDVHEHGVMWTFWRNRDATAGCAIGEGKLELFLSSRIDPSRPPPEWHWGGVGFRVDQFFMPRGVFIVRCIEAPFWFAFIAFLGYPLFSLVSGRYRQVQRRKKGLCMKCGYCLLGLNERRCPECGNAF